MANTLDDGITRMMSLLTQFSGTEAVYIRGNATTTVTLRKCVQPAIQLDTGTGHIIEVSPVDFLGSTSTLPYAEPVKGDRIKVGSETFEVDPVVGNTVYRRVSPALTRIHTKKVG